LIAMPLAELLAGMGRRLRYIGHLGRGGDRHHSLSPRLDDRGCRVASGKRRFRRRGNTPDGAAHTRAHQRRCWKGAA